MKKLFLYILTTACIFACKDNSVSYPTINVKEAETFLDSRDGKEYKCIEIGDQIWMAENLAYVLVSDSICDCRTFEEDFVSTQNFISESSRTFRDSLNSAFNSGKISDPENLADEDKPSKKIQDWCGQKISISNIIKNAEADPYFTPEIITVMKSYQKIIESSIHYRQIEKADKENGAYSSEYGMLYSLDAALAAVPTEGGWRLPSDSDWKKLERYLGMSEADVNKENMWRGNIEGELLKAGEHGIGFNALYGGGKMYIPRFDDRDDYLTYTHKGQNAYFWTSEKTTTADSLTVGMIRSVAVFSQQILRTTTQLRNEDGHPVLFNVRLVKDLK